MKKMVSLLSLIICACTPRASSQTGSLSLEAEKIGQLSEPIHNEKCADIQKYKIFQVMSDGALAFACETKFGEEACFGLVAYAPKKKGLSYYDEMIVEPVKGQCISYDGVFQYPTKNGFHKTVPKLKFIAE